MANPSQNRRNPTAGTHRVKTHRRQTPSGKVSRVNQHRRTNRGTTRGRQRTEPARRPPARQPVLRTSRAKTNLTRALRLRQVRPGKAIGLACAALAEVLAIVVIQSVLLAVVAFGAILFALGVVVQDITKDH